MKVNFDLCGVNIDEMRSFQNKIDNIYCKLYSNDHSAGTDWVDWPALCDGDVLEPIYKLANEINKNSEVLFVIGIGGSFLGAKSGIELLGQKSKTNVRFIGYNMDYENLLNELGYAKDMNVTVNVVSKSGSTSEILATLNIVEDFLKDKYGKDYIKHLIFTTDMESGYLSDRAKSKGITLLGIPKYMGGRYSVLSAVGLLPFAVAGIDIKKLIDGAKDAYNELKSPLVENNNSLKYAVYRYLLKNKLNKSIELFASFIPNFRFFGDWLSQLFNESEGKDGNGLFVTNASYSTDLHSIGQFIQDGSRILGETIISSNYFNKDTSLKNITNESPIKFLEGKKISEIIKAQLEGTVKAHSLADVPIIIIDLDRIDEYNYGYLVYFFEHACAVSGYLLSINPFNQPGVEQYKNCMKELL